VGRPRLRREERVWLDIRILGVRNRRNMVMNSKKIWTLKETIKAYWHYPVTDIETEKQHKISYKTACNLARKKWDQIYSIAGYNELPLSSFLRHFSRRIYNVANESRTTRYSPCI
jgi:hypothetical protein